MVEMAEIEPGRGESARRRLGFRRRSEAMAGQDGGQAGDAGSASYVHPLHPPQ